MQYLHAFGDDALGDDDTVGLVQRLRAGEVSAAELVDAAIARTEAVNPHLNGMAYRAFDRARAVARQTSGSSSGYFAGIPTFVKDNVDVAGMPTMRGTDAWDPAPAAADGEFPRTYLATGLNPLGRTRMSEFGFSASAEHPRLGAVRNPWDTDYTAGASSSGSAALVAAGVAPIAHANDGGGSIRIPAACNGLVGLKPSQGRFPLDKEFRQMPLRIVINGVLTRSVRDTAVFYREAERLWRNHRIAPVGDVTGPGRGRLKIAVLTRSIGRDCSAEVRAETMKTAALLEDLGHRVEQVERPPIPDSFADDFVLYWAFLAMALVRMGRQSFGPSFDRERLDDLTLGLDRLAGRRLYRLPLALGRLAASRRHSARFFRDYDVLLTPTLAHATPRIGYLDPAVGYDQLIERLMDWVAFTPLQNVTGEPSISLPLAQSAGGLPLGMMFSAPLGQDARLLELAYELEQAKPWTTIAACA
ncbi:amidase [Mycolicibacter minnesotensis]